MVLTVVVFGILSWARDDRAADSGNAGSGELKLTMEDQSTAVKLVRAAEASHLAIQRLAQLCDTFGPRFSGTTNLEAAIDWVLEQMKADGLEHVHGEEVTVPHWVRGSESAEILQPVHRTLPMAGLGGSVGTPGPGINAPVLVVRNFAELKQRGGEARGRMILFNAPFVSYGETVEYRVRGAVEAAKVGGVACLVRSITPFSLQTPHTGSMTYQAGVEQIPSAAITLEDADQLQRWQDHGQAIALRLQMSATVLPDAPSCNVVAEIPGRENPEEIVLVSGHIDSWDISPGAQDDGGGAMAAWEALRLMHELGLRPRRTIRVVLWTNEENGVRGAKDYAKRHRQELGKHVLAIEADNGTFPPTGFTFKGSEKAKSVCSQVGSLLAELHADRIVSGDGGTDVGVLAQAGVPVMELTVENSKYFWFHHTAADTPDKITSTDLARCAAALAVMAYTVADLPTPLLR
jgi:carboxypeptidase Q